MEHLLPHYEREVGLLSRHLTEFAQRFPKIAARIGLAGSHVDDMHVDRMIQTFALLSARIDQKLDDAYPQFAEALLEGIYPQYLRTIPSCAIASFDPSSMFGQLTTPLIIPRGTMLDANAAPCRFRTVYDVTLTPLRIEAAGYSPAVFAPAAARIPTDTTGIISLTFASEAASQSFDATIPFGPIRIHLAGGKQLLPALTDALLLNASTAYFEIDGNRRWIKLPRIPIEGVGFDSNENLLPDEPSTPSQYFRSLIEYFTFPDKFDFIDIDLGLIRHAAHNTGSRLTLHVAVRNVGSDSNTAQVLTTLDTHAFRLFCTPVVNLFERAATPIQPTSRDASYPIVPIPLATGVPLSVYSINGVYLKNSNESDDDEAVTEHAMSREQLLPYRAPNHAQRSTTPYWIAHRDPEAGPNAALATCWLSLLDLEGRPTNPLDPQIDVSVMATNGDMPSRIPIGAPDSDLLYEGSALACPITLLSQPTLPLAMPREGALWRVLSALASHPLDLSRASLPDLKAFLHLHAPRSNVIAQRCIDAITGIDCQPATKWLSLASAFPSFVRGIEILMSMTESSMRDVSLHRVATVMDPLFSRYAPSNSFSQLIVLSAETGEELLRCAPRPGTRPLL
ncbi:type VI secretion system baseplate subunit TssF [Burkholderia sp. Ac-20379]|uniref:type VI secretion system baseplate subunit TssF n=1 Tax=Burkholderia sp. Ac-20379 TaxID=2703900 RepID=UPI00197E5913|nr:type VI secretion system baseplate subunit TssF [Burkholderia sp. Ac-20379]MBN3723259.1 type VI secretion system baseplate subunit TssF [Burkholderia sp. Ac-20379]